MKEFGKAIRSFSQVQVKNQFSVIFSNEIENILQTSF